MAKPAQSGPAKTGRQQDARFKPGRSGNPNGRPVGSRHKTTLAMNALLDGDAENLTRKAISMALEGDTVAMRLCLDRLAPPRRDRPVSFALPKLDTAEDAKAAVAAILQGVADGDLTPGEAVELSKLLESYTRLIEVADFQKRLEALEKARTP